MLFCSDSHSFSSRLLQLCDPECSLQAADRRLVGGGGTWQESLWGGAPLPPLGGEGGLWMVEKVSKRWPEDSRWCSWCKQKAPGTMACSQSLRWYRWWARRRSQRTARFATAHRWQLLRIGVQSFLPVRRMWERWRKASHTSTVKVLAQRRLRVQQPEVQWLCGCGNGMKWSSATLLAKTWDPKKDKDPRQGWSFQTEQWTFLLITNLKYNILNHWSSMIPIPFKAWDLWTLYVY